VVDARRAESIARQYVDVVTTGGPATGEAPSVRKIRHMSSALQGLPLAFASGITPDNISQFVPHAKCYLVATGISKTSHELDARYSRAFWRSYATTMSNAPPVA
jgi:predicted TIM-barrel enzyme